MIPEVAAVKIDADGKAAAIFKPGSVPSEAATAWAVSAAAGRRSRSHRSRCAAPDRSERRVSGQVGSRWSRRGRRSGEACSVAPRLRARPLSGQSLLPRRLLPRRPPLRPSPPPRPPLWRRLPLPRPRSRPWASSAPRTTPPNSVVPAFSRPCIRARTPAASSSRSSAMSRPRFPTATIALPFIETRPSGLVSCRRRAPAPMAPIFPFRRPTAFIRRSSRPSVASRDAMPRPVGVSTPGARPVDLVPPRSGVSSASSDTGGPVSSFRSPLTKAPRVTASAPWPDADPRTPTAVRPRWRRGSLSVSPAPIARSRPTATGRRACSRRSSPSFRPSD